MKLSKQWGKTARVFWKDFQWLALGALWLVGLYLGFAGYSEYAAWHQKPLSVFDQVYLTINLISMGADNLASPLPWKLELARWALPSLTALAALKAILGLFWQQFSAVSLRFLRGHVIICGLSRKGFLLARNFHQRGARVVVIERNKDNEWIEQCRHEGILVLLGDATDEYQLLRAGVVHARYLLATCNLDGINADIAMKARGLVLPQKRSRLICILHIVEPQLYRLLRQMEIHKTGSFQIEVFNVFELGVQQLWQEHPVFDLNEAESMQRGHHFLIIGLGRFGEGLITRSAWLWWKIFKQSGNKLTVTVIDRAATARIESLVLRYPHLTKICDLNCYQMDVNSPEFLQAAYLKNMAGQPEIEAAYVCLDHDALGMHVGLLLRHILPGRIPIVVRTAEQTGLASLLTDRDIKPGSIRNLTAFGLLDKACLLGEMFLTTYELLARATHEAYVHQQKALGHTVVTNPSLLPWEKLSAVKQKANFSRVDRIYRELESVGYGIAPLTDWDAADIEFDPEQTDLMSRMEHELWVREMNQEGWKIGFRNDKKKTHPGLVSWEQLSEADREKTRNLVRELPALLEKVGLQVYPLIQSLN